MAGTTRQKPRLNFEKHFWQSGFTSVVGIDEAGVAPLAGPVVAAAVMLKPSTSMRQLQNVQDSKLLTETAREQLYQLIIDTCQSWGTGLATPKEIDRLNIHQATRLAMQRATEQIAGRQALLIDGPFVIPGLAGLQLAVVDGDAKVASIAAASIIAKVTRDRLMQEQHRLYPSYGFDRHKGYPTPGHIALVRKLGPCPIHRRSFIKKFC